MSFARIMRQADAHKAGADQRPSSIPVLPLTVGRAVSSPGQPLAGELRAELESAFAFDFSRVRVHTDRQAELSAGAIGARAYTIANHVVFGAGTYAPQTSAGRRLIAHELAHVVQQSNARTAVVQRQADPGATTIPMKVVPHGASEAAVKAAEAQLREVLGAADLAQLKGETIELHIIPANRKLTDLPEYANLKGVRTWDRKRVYDEIRGAGAEKVGSVIRYAVAEEQLVKVPGHDMAYAPGFVGTHESGHVVQQFALTKRQNDDLTAAYNARVKAGGPWLAPASYTRGNVGEYFAQGTAAYLGHPYSTSAEDKKTYTKDWLQKNDPALFKLLDEIYGARPAQRPPPSFRPRTDFNDKMQRDVENL